MVSDGLTGLSESITATWPEAIHQTCVLHLIRNTFRYASKPVWPPIAADLRPVYQAATEAAAAAVRRLRREVGPPISSDHQTLGIGVGGIRAIIVACRL